MTPLRSRNTTARMRRAPPRFGSATALVVVGQPFQIQATSMERWLASRFRSARCRRRRAGNRGVDRNGADAAGNTIIRPGNYTVPITLSVVDPTGQTTLSTSTVTGRRRRRSRSTHAGGLGVNRDDYRKRPRERRRGRSCSRRRGAGLNLYVSEFGNTSIPSHPRAPAGTPLRCVR